MKVLTNTVLVALLAGSIGVAGLVPSYAAPAAAAPQWGMMGHQWGGQHPGMRGGRHGGFGMTLMRLGCSDRGAEALEIAFVRAKYELKLTATQQPLLDTLQTAALADQKSFETTCKSTFGDKDAAAAKTLADRLQDGLTLSQARVTALQDVVPKFKAFYDSLSTDQQAQLNAHAWRGNGRFGMHKPGDQDMTTPDGTMQPNGTAPADNSGKAATPSST